MPSIDQGIVLYGIGSGTSASGSIAGNGGAVVPRLFYSGVFRASDTFGAGRAPHASITVQGTLSSGAGLQVGVERQRFDTNNSGLPKWSLVATTRTDVSGTPVGFQPFQVVGPAHLAGQVVDASTGALTSGTATETLAVTLRAYDLEGASAVRVIAKVCSGSILASGDFAIISVDAR